MAIELRCPDSAANPYLALAVCMAAGLDGIKQKIVPPSPVDRNISDLTEEERNAMQITLLPGSLGEAVAELKKDDFSVSGTRPGICEWIYQCQRRRVA